MSSFFQKIGLSKTHKYESTLPLEHFSVEQILRIDPKDVGFNIREKEGIRKLEDAEKSKALAYLLLIKENEKKGIWKEEDRNKHIEKYLETESKLNEQVRRQENSLIKNAQEEVKTEQRFARDMQGRLNELDPTYTDLRTRAKNLNAVPTTTIDDELADYFDENGGRRKSKRRRRSTKLKKNKTKHIKHSKSKKNKSTKKFQKRKTRVTRNK